MNYPPPPSQGGSDMPYNTPPAAPGGGNAPPPAAEDSSIGERSGSAENAVQPAEPPAGMDSKGRVRRTKVGGVWVALVLAALLLILLIIFIAQNTTKVAIHFLGFNGHISLGLALLIGAVAGLLVAGAIGTVRIMQLRKALKRNTLAND
jgi:uncharacterized integral membrane protein